MTMERCGQICLILVFLYDDVDDMMQVLDTEGGRLENGCRIRFWDEFHVKVIAPFYLVGDVMYGFQTAYLQFRPP